jgi:hypothetical protein
MPESVLVRMKPQRVARAIVGHVLAANAACEAGSPPVRAPFQDALRAYFLDKDAPLPSQAEIYCWVYPHRQQVFMKGVAKQWWGGGPTLVGHVLKFFPLGFWIVWDRPARIGIPLRALVPDNRMALDDMDQADISLRRVPRQDFPETPTDDEVTLFASSAASVGTPRGRAPQEVAGPPWPT